MSNERNNQILDETLDTCTDAQIQTLINGLNTLKKNRSQ